MPMPPPGWWRRRRPSSSLTRKPSANPPASPIPLSIPFLYYVLYAFLLHQMVSDLALARDDPKRKARIDTRYVVISIVVYGSIYLFGR